MAPAHLRDVKQTICSAKIDERTEIGNILHNTVHGISDMDPLKQLLLKLFLALYQNLLAVADNAMSARIELRHDKLDLLAVVSFQILLIRIGNQRSRNENTSAVDNSNQTAVRNLNNRRLQDLMAVKCFLKTLIALLGSKSLVGKNGLTFAVIDLQNLRFHDIADFDDLSQINAGIIRVFTLGNDSV